MVLKTRKSNEYALIHHRKTSIGSDSIDNVHPFPINNGRFFLIQNGSSQIVHDWGVIHFLSEIKTHSDTYYLTKFLEEKGCDSLGSIGDVLGKLIKTGVTLGVIAVVDTSNDTILLLSDGARSLYIDINESETIVESFSSLTDEGSSDYTFRGYMIVDFNGNVLSLKYDFINRIPPKVVKEWKGHATQQSAPYAIDYDKYDDLDDYYEKKKNQQHALVSLGDSESWELGSGKDNANCIDPCMIVDSTDLQSYFTEFWECEKDLAGRKDGFSSGGVWDNLIKRLEITANLINMEMRGLVDDFYETYGAEDTEYLYEYIEHESMCIMDTVLEYNPNFEFDDVDDDII